MEVIGEGKYFSLDTNFWVEKYGSSSLIIGLAEGDDFGKGYFADLNDLKNISTIVKRVDFEKQGSYYLIPDKKEKILLCYNNYENNSSIGLLINKEWKGLKRVTAKVMLEFADNLKDLIFKLELQKEKDELVDFVKRYNRNKFSVKR